MLRKCCFYNAFWKCVLSPSVTIGKSPVHLCLPANSREGRSRLSLPIALVFLCIDWYLQSSFSVWEWSALLSCHFRFLSYVSSPLLLTYIFPLKFLHWMGPVFELHVNGPYTFSVCSYTNKANMQIQLKEACFHELCLPSFCFWEIPWQQSFRPHATCLLRCFPRHTV